MKKVTIIVALLLSAACANKTTPLAVSAVAHDALAQAQDLEANLCFGVTDAIAVASLPDKTHCTTAIAATVGLTDAKHKEIAQGMVTAWQLYRTATAVVQTGASADYSSMNAALQSVLQVLATLKQQGTVPQLIQAVTAAKK